MKTSFALIGLLAAAAQLPVIGAVSEPQLLPLATARQFPYSMVGQLIFTSGDADFQGSGTVIQVRSVLSAAHNLWDVEGGWSTNVEFNRARHGAAVPAQAFANRLYIFGGYRSSALTHGTDSVKTFAKDLGGLRFAAPVAAGSYVGWRSDITLLAGEAYNIAVGYGAEAHSGDDLLFVEPSLGFAQRAEAFLENRSMTFEPGMSGGPVFAEIGTNDLRVVGVIVAGSDDPPSAGIRALSSDAVAFMKAYLRY